MHQVFIDGEAGTTGLQIRQRLDGRTDITLIRLDDARRKDPVARAEALAAADIAILCLPDGATPAPPIGWPRAGSTGLPR